MLRYEETSRSCTTCDRSSPLVKANAIGRRLDGRWLLPGELQQLQLLSWALHPQLWRHRLLRTVRTALSTLDRRNEHFAFINQPARSQHRRAEVADIDTSREPRRYLARMADRPAYQHAQQEEHRG